MKGKKKGQKSKRRKEHTSQDSQFNLFIGFSVEDMSRTVWMRVCGLIGRFVCKEGVCVRKAWVCVVSNRE